MLFGSKCFGPRSDVVKVFFRRGNALRVRFGDCVFDGSARELTRAGQPVHLPPKAFRLLELLISKRPRAVTKAEIRDALWPATTVAESSLARVVVDVRSAIGDDARHPRLLRTVHGFGYSFAAEAVLEQVPGPAQHEAWACRIVRGEREIVLVEGEHILGRLPDASVWIDSTSVSRRHARIVVSAGRAVLEDLGSKNGTYLRGTRLTSPSELTDGDVIAIGSVVLTFRAARAAVSTKSASRAGRNEGGAPRRR
jgi:DNA-binding winged helix-turn-helix (wHTH) protein